MISICRGTHVTHAAQYIPRDHDGENREQRDTQYTLWLKTPDNFCLGPRLNSTRLIGVPPIAHSCHQVPDGNQERILASCPSESSECSDRSPSKWA